MTTESNHRAKSRFMAKGQIDKLIEFARRNPELTQREIAERFECSTGTCGAHIRKAKKALGDEFFIVKPSNEPKSMYEKVLAIYQKDEGYIDALIVADQLGITRRQVLESLANLRNRREHRFSSRTNERGIKEFRYEGKSIPDPDQVNRLPPSPFKTAFALMSI